jgi:hypothetical protein
MIKRSLFILARLFYSLAVTENLRDFGACSGDMPLNQSCRPSDIAQQRCFQKCAMLIAIFIHGSGKSRLDAEISRGSIDILSDQLLQPIARCRREGKMKGAMGA